MIVADRLTKVYPGKRAIEDVSFEIGAGEIVGFLGPNGAGKSTTVHIAVGLLAPDAGTVDVGGLGSPRQPAVRARIGVAPQALSLYELLTAEENLEFYGRIYEMPADRLASRVTWALEFVGLATPPKTKVGGLNARERRLVELARAVVGNPRLVLLDEPAAGLPDEETAHLSQVIRKIPDAFGALTILVDHDMSLVSRCCATTAVLDFGKLIALGPTAEVLRDEQVIKAYLGTEDDVAPLDAAEDE